MVSGSNKPIAQKGTPKNLHMAPLHKIIQKNAYAQSLFFWVDGAMGVDTSLTPRRAIQKYKARFSITDLDVRSAVTQFNRMKSLYLKQNNIFTL